MTKSPSAEDRTMNLAVAPTTATCASSCPTVPGVNLRSVSRHNADGTETFLSGNNF